jgi:hypothetical protein
LVLSRRALDLSRHSLLFCEVTMYFVLAQCVMCLRTAAAQQVERARVLNEGIIVLAAPSLFILATFVYLIYSRRH